MVLSQWHRRVLIAVLSLFTVRTSTVTAQDSTVKPATASGPAAEASNYAGTAIAALLEAVAPAPTEDPVLTLIATSERHFEAGQKELENGHFEAAKQEFNRAVGVLLES